VPLESELHGGSDMAQSFGERLRHERERRQISLASIAASSKVSVALFKGLEGDDLSRWPTGIFRRSFVRSYATAVGLEPDAVVREFLERHPDPLEAATDAAAEAALLVPATRGLPNGVRLRFAVFAKRHIISSVRARWAAVSVDVAVILAIGFAMFLFMDAFWMPVAVFMFCYYVGSILMVGNTPGACLAASTSDPPC
jgi:transcriptional regulator with XRE-family HTH domain